MKKIITSLLLLFVTSVLFAQQSTGYQLLECKDHIPLRLIESSTSKYKKDLAKLKELEQSKKERKLLSKFSLESHFVLDKLLQSGAVLFNDDVSNYLNTIAQKVLANESQELKNKVKVYTLRSAYVNAFATERGDIFVTLGLLARLENESQLAFILSHEISHVQEKHTIKSVLEGARVDKKGARKNRARTAVSDKRVLSKSMYAKELELEADSLAVGRYVNAGYAEENIISVFELLKTSQQPYSKSPFDFSELEAGSYSIPSKYKTFKVDSLEAVDENEDDAGHTHPNIGKRKEQVKRILGRKIVANTANAIAVNKAFDNAILKAKMELPMLYLHNGQASKCIYIAQALLKESPNNKYLKKCIAKALYIEAKFQNDKDYREIVLVDEVTGNIQQVYNLMEEMDDKETLALAMNYTWRQHDAWSDDKELAYMAKDITYELLRYTDGLKEFTEVDTAKGMYWKKAMIDYKDNKDLLAYFKESEKRYAAYKSRKPPKKKRKNQKALGINKVVVINPQYLQMDMRHGNTVRFVTSEAGRYRVADIVKLAAEKSGLDCKVLDVKNLKKGQIDEFNDLRFLNEWFSEQTDFGELNITPGYNQERVSEIAKKYGTKHFLWTGVISAQQVNRSWITVPLSLFFPPAIPFTTYAAIKPRYHMFYYSILFNVETGAYETLGYDYFKRKDSDALMKAHIYDSFNQIKQKSKKKK